MDEPANPPAAPSDGRQEAQGLLKGFLSYLGLRSVGILLGYVTQIFLSRWLGSHNFGYYSVLATSAFVLAYIVGLGYPTAMQRFLPTYRLKGDWASFRGMVGFAAQKMLRASFFLAVLGGLVLGIGHELHTGTDPFYMAETWAALTILLLIPVQAAQEVYEAGLTAQQRWLDSFLPSMVLTPVLFMISIAITDYFVPGKILVVHVLLDYLVVNFLSTSLQRYLLRRSYPPGATREPVNVSDAPTWRDTSRPVLVMTMFGILTARADLFGVALFDGHDDAGIYAAVLATAELLNTFSKAANTVVTPLIGPLLMQKNETALQKVLVDSARLATYPTMIVAIFLTYCGSDVLEIFGAGYSSGYWALVVLTWNQVLIASAGPPAYVLIVSGHSVKVAEGFAMSLALQIVLLVILTWKFRMLGASASSLLAGLFLRTLLSWYVTRYTGIRFGFLGGLTHTGLRGPR